MTRTIARELYIAWDGTNYQDETARLIQATGENKLTAPDAIGQGRGIVDRCTLELANHDGRYSPLNSSGALYAHLQGGGAYHRPMYLRVAVDGSTFSRIFTGVIKLPKESTPTPHAIATATIECRSLDEVLLGRRMSTSTANLQAAYSGGYTEGGIINQWMVLAGLTGVVDSGVFVVPWAWLDDESILEEMWQLASACGGRFYCDPDGTFRYEDATHWLKSPHTVSQETITRSGMGGFEPQYSDGDLYSEITVEASARNLGASEVLWEPDEPVVIPPGATRTMTARLSQPAYSLDAPTMNAATSGGYDVTASVTVTVTAANVQRVELSIANAHGEAAYLHPFHITGRSLTGGPTQEEKRTSATHGSNGTWWTTRGTRSKTIRGNAYIQTRAHAAALALFLLHRSEYPRLSYELRNVPGVPTRRCGDRITVNDTATMSSARDAFVTGIRWRLTSNGFTQDITAIDAAQLFPYQTEGYFILGSSKLGASGAGTAHIWY